MIFILTKPNKYCTADACKAAILTGGCRFVIRHNMLAAEVAMDRYCREHFSSPLKMLCLRILQSIKVSEVDDHFTAIIPDKHLEKIARTITYGTGKIGGSRILADALRTF